jgi:hypothetical protein
LESILCKSSSSAAGTSGRSLCTLGVSSKSAVVDVPDDARVRELGQDLRLAREPRRVLGGVARQELDGHRLTRRLVERPPHLAHPPGPREALEEVAPRQNSFFSHGAEYRAPQPSV